ncbi:hypothetical protein [Frigoriflavimonas asaccharolytica]|uniref:Uncharacterized protein n=1 Tax=Frigoriflavimonas asaccharolytica TaxID=2735899 RepID=A0A8J8K9F0_9FLAO|nr:hypothetical protein [Frigoriflavimonas asaccharolytica]NRS93738.1 hypothetical protein [Frigoriflavimonas asaccharolytica]
MDKQTIYNANMHFEHKIWNGELDFWKFELKFFNEKLSELSTRWTNKSVLSQLEHFQNEFILHGGVIEDLEEIIEKHEIRISAQSIIDEVPLDIQLVKMHFEFRNRMETQRSIYLELKKGFFRFLEESM